MLIADAVEVCVCACVFGGGGCTHQQSGQSSHHSVQQDGRDGAPVLGSQVGFGVHGVVAQESLHVHSEGVRVLKVVGQHDGPGHDHQLEVQHDAERQLQRLVRTNRFQSAPPPRTPDPPLLAGLLVLRLYIGTG